MDSVTIRFSSQKDLKRRSTNYRPTRKTRSVIAPKRWPNWFGILILRAGQHESDWNANSRWCSWFETPAAEGGNGGVIQNRITDALLHHGIDGQSAVGIDTDHGDAAPGDMPAARLVGIVGSRRAESRTPSHSPLRLAVFAPMAEWERGSVAF